MAVKGSAVIKKATALLGKTGTTVWNYYGLARGTAWCAAFVSYVMNKAGAKALFYGGKPVFYVPYAQQWLAKNCTHVKMADAKPGDIVVFTWDGIGNNSEKGSRDHIGFIRKAGTSKIAYTIEGNTDGGKVANKTRALKWIYGIYRPKYAAETTTVKKAYAGTFPTLPARGYFKKGDTGPQVKLLQKLLNWVVDAKLVIDGILGTKTAAAIGTFEKKYGLVVDKLFGKKCLAKAKTIKK